MNGTGLMLFINKPQTCVPGRSKRKIDVYIIDINRKSGFNRIFCTKTKANLK